MNQKQQMEKLDEFVERFTSTSSDINHILNVRRYYEKIKSVGALVYFGVWIGLGLVIVIFPEPGSPIRTWSFRILGTVFISLILARTILFIEIARNSLSSEKLALHELAQAVDAYTASQPDYNAWQTHLSNVNELIENHDPKIFSKYQNRQAVRYLHFIKQTDGNNRSKSEFEDFYDDLLVDLLEQREIEATWADIDTTTQEDNSRFIGVLLSSIVGIASEAKSRSWVLVVLSLCVGAILFLTSREQAAYSVTIILLSIIGLRSQGD